MSLNAPQAGTIKEFLVNEEDTVTVGQDVVKLEIGGEAPAGGKQEANDEPKEPASKDQETSSQPSGEQEQSKSQDQKQPEPAKHESKPEPPKQESKPQPPKQPEPKKDAKPAPKDESKQTQPGSRGENRVRGSASTASTHANHLCRSR